MTSNKICKVPVFQECSQISSSAWIWRERPMSGKIMRTTQTKVEIGACKYVYRTMIEKNTIDSSFILPLFCCYYCFFGVHLNRQWSKLCCTQVRWGYHMGCGVETWSAACKASLWSSVLSLQPQQFYYLLS